MEYSDGCSTAVRHVVRKVVSYTSPPVLEIEINRHKETLEAVVTDLDGMDIFLGHDWLVKHNLEVN